MPRMPILAPLHIRTLLSLLLLAALVPAVVVVTLGHLMDQRQALAAARSGLRTTTQLVAANQAQVVEGVRQMLLSLASGPSLRRPELRRLCPEFLGNILRASPDYGNLGLIDLEGRVVCQGHPAQLPFNAADRGYFQRALELRGFAVGTHLVGRVAGQQLLGFGTPVHDDDGRLIGVAFAALDLAVANQRLRALDLPPGLEVHVLDSQGVVLARNAPSARRIGERATDLQGFARSPPREGWIDESADVAGGSLQVIVSSASEALLAPARQRLRDQLLALLLASLVGVAVAGWLASRHVMRPVARLLQGIRGIDDAAATTPGPPRGRTLIREFVLLESELARTRSRMNEQRQQLLKAQALARVGFFRLDVAAGRYTVSPVVFEMLGLPPSAEGVALDAYTALIHPDDLDMVLVHRRHLMTSREPLRLGFRIRRPDGEVRWVESYGLLEHGEDGRPLTYVGAIQDVSEQRRLRRLLDLHRRLGAAMITATTAQQILDQVCGIAIDSGGFRVAWAGEPTGDGQGLACRSRAGDDDGGLAQHIASAARLDGSPSCIARDALDQGRPVVCNDIEGSPALAPWREAARAGGFRALAALPVGDAGDGPVLLLLLAAERHCFQAEELALLEAIGESIRVALGRLRAERRVGLMSRRMTDLLTATADGFVAIDRAWRITHANQQFCRLLGLPAADPVASDLRDAAQDVLSSEAAARIEAVLDGGEARTISLRAAGRWLDLTAYPSAEGSSIFLRDVSARRQAAERLEAQLARLQLLGRLTRAALSCEHLDELYDTSVSELRSSLPADLCIALILGGDPPTCRLRSLSVSPEHGQGLTRRRDDVWPLAAGCVERVRRGETVCDEDAAQALPPGLAGSGGRSAMVAPLRAGQLTLGALLVARVDDTGFGAVDVDFVSQFAEHVALLAQQMRLRDDLQRAYVHLQNAQRVAIEHERLRALGQMAAGVAHDINNAISPVTLYVEALLEEDVALEAAERRRYLGTIQRAIDDVARTVVRMRDFSKGSDEPGDAFGAVDLRLLCESALAQAQAGWRSAGLPGAGSVEVALELPPDLPPVHARMAELREALVQLMTNAVEAMPAGGRLSVRAELEGQAEGFVTIEVADEGPGMDSWTRRRCVEPFFTTKGARGSGMGLAVAYGTAVRHGGSLAIDSAPGAGTRARLALPTRVVVEAGGASAGPRPLHILLIDDEERVAASIADMLGHDGHAVEVALGGHAGVDRFLARQAAGPAFDAVITDLVMPEVDGLRVAELIKRARAGVPVVLLTGWGAQIASPAQVDAVVAKPARMNRLRQVLAQLTAGAAPAPPQP